MKKTNYLTIILFISSIALTACKSLEEHVRGVRDDSGEKVTVGKVQAEIEDSPCFIVELSYASVVQLNNIDESNKSFVILVEIPRMLFPFARRIIADTVRDGGFPPLYIEPIDFLKLFEKNIQKH